MPDSRIPLYGIPLSHPVLAAREDLARLPPASTR
jgi:hypothetical protein